MAAVASSAGAARFICSSKLSPPAPAAGRPPGPSRTATPLEGRARPFMGRTKGTVNGSYTLPRQPAFWPRLSLLPKWRRSPRVTYGEDRPLGGAQLADHRSDRGHVLRRRRRLDAEDVRFWDANSRQRQVGADGVIVVAMGDGADDGVAIRPAPPGAAGAR